MIPNISAFCFLTFPVGMGLKHYLFISASKSDSYHIFKDPAAPAHKATAAKDKVAVIKST